MNEQLSETLAAELATLHNEALSLASTARDQIDAALNKAADAGQLIEKARELYHGGLHDWLREHVPTLPVQQAEIYHGIHKVRKKRDYIEADTRQLKLIGIIGDEDLAEHGGTNKGQRSGGDRWVKWAGHIVHHFKDIEAERPIEKWETFERNALVDALAPIVELWVKANGGGPNTEWRNSVISGLKSLKS